MDLKNQLERHPVITILGLLLAGFCAGWGAKVAAERAAGLRTISATDLDDFSAFKAMNADWFAEQGSLPWYLKDWASMSEVAKHKHILAVKVSEASRTNDPVIRKMQEKIEDMTQLLEIREQQLHELNLTILELRADARKVSALESEVGASPND